MITQCDKTLLSVSAIFLMATDRSDAEEDSGCGLRRKAEGRGSAPSAAAGSSQRRMIFDIQSVRAAATRRESGLVSACQRISENPMSEGNIRLYVDECPSTSDWSLFLNPACAGRVLRVGGPA
ncbi:hypothetical protein FB471_4897 [Amycolatopsis cihanbeyliensis]|uniref:Uncharacterized protein n=1 Tax=Amycolatopsis cihanbeyliensis TaxID=1128664 RepID=A0A542DQ09_AMYCI|nr:hypothetical protein FB471_4897 [Amycolatopsis cihanbeyliensis]